LTEEGNNKKRKGGGLGYKITATTILMTLLRISRSLEENILKQLLNSIHSKTALSTVCLLGRQLKDNRRMWTKRLDKNAS
jgi:hypothetical protein